MRILSERKNTVVTERPAAIQSGPPAQSTTSPNQQIPARAESETRVAIRTVGVLFPDSRDWVASTKTTINGGAMI